MGEHPRVVEGTKMLLDRAMDDRRHQLRQSPDPRQDDRPDSRPDRPDAAGAAGRDPIRASQRPFVICASRLNTDDLDHLCWAKLALDLLSPSAGRRRDADRRSTATFSAAEEERRQTGWLRPNCYRQALTILALGVGQRNSLLCPLGEPSPGKGPVDAAVNRPLTGLGSPE